MASRRRSPEAVLSPEQPFLASLGERTRTQRARRGMTRKRLAQQSGVSERYIAQLEGGAGNVSVLVLRAVAHALGVTPASLLDGEERPSAPPSDWSAPEDGPRRHVALVGLRGAGKSTLGRMLAAARSVPFVELDRVIEGDAGLSIGEVLELHGQAGFRRLERQALERVVGAGAAVIETGGSLVSEPATYGLLLARCFVVWLRASPSAHLSRVTEQGDLRPMAESRAAMDDLRAILASREALYGLADRVLDTTDRNVAQSFEELSGLLGPA